MTGQEEFEALAARLVRAAGLYEPGRLTAAGVSASEGSALAELATGPGLSQQDLADRLGLEKSTISRLVTGLERKGWITRERDPDNRRYYRLQLTRTGKTTARKVRTAWHERHQRILTALTPTEREALGVVLAGLIRVFEAEHRSPDR